MRFIVDAQLPPVVAQWLRSRGHEAEHVFELAGNPLPDRAIWKRAKETQSVIITKDEDFSLFRILESGGPSIIWIKTGNTRKAHLMRMLQSALPNIERSLSAEPAIIELN